MWRTLTAEYGDNPVVIVTGASSSIGGVLTTLFLQRGCTVHFVTSERARFDEYVKTSGLTGVEVNRLRYLDRGHFPSALATCDIWCMGVLPSHEELSLVRASATVLNYTALSAVEMCEGLRAVDIGTMRLAPKSNFRHNSRYSHGLNRGELHSCMVGGIMRALNGAEDHEGPVAVSEVLNKLDAQMSTLGALGFLPPLPSRPFHCQGDSDILEYLRMRVSWYPSAEVRVELNNAGKETRIFDLNLPDDLAEFREYLTAHSISDNTPMKWEIAGEHIQLEVSSFCLRG